MRKIVLLSAATAVFVVGCSSPSENPSTETAGGGNAPASASGEGSATGGKPLAVSFKDIHELLNAKCAGCHGVSNPKEEFSVVSYESIMKGSEHGLVIVAGDAANSKIVKAIRGQGMDRMPYKMDPLSDEDIAKVEAWINAGARSE